MDPAMTSPLEAIFLPRDTVLFQISPAQVLLVQSHQVLVALNKDLGSPHTLRLGHAGPSVLNSFSAWMTVTAIASPGSH